MTRKLRILIADDSDVLRSAICGLISRIDNCEICGEARDGAEALTKVAKLNPDVILLDLSIPIIHGLQVAQTLAKDYPSISVVIMSEQDEFLLKHISNENGIKHCIAKSNLASGLAPLLQTLAQSNIQGDPVTIDE
jgi:DNA-binding NarL/FixJ family response regulator